MVISLTCPGCCKAIVVLEKLAGKKMACPSCKAVLQIPHQHKEVNVEAGSGVKGMLIKYRKHGGEHRVAIVHCPRICGKRLVHLSQDGPNSWIILDYIVGQQLRRSPPPNPSYSTHDLGIIEATVVWSEVPPYHPWDKKGDWEAYLRLRTKAVLGRTVDDTPPNSDFGLWRQFWNKHPS